MDFGVEQTELQDWEGGKVRLRDIFRVWTFLWTFGQG